MKIYIMVGCSGSGKSTWIKENHPDAKVVSSDLYPPLYANGFNPKLLGESHGWCMREYVEAVQDGDSTSPTPVVVVDNTNTTMQEIAPYCAIASAYGVPFEIVVVDTPWTLSAPRNTHGVPEKKVKEQAERITRLMKQIPRYWPTRFV